MEEKKDNILNEPAASYHTQRVTTTETPSFVLEDYKIGMEQYKNGECISMDIFLKTLAQDV